MFINGKYRGIGSVDIAKLKKQVNEISAEQWAAFSQRQGVYDVHSATQTIPLIFDADFRHRYPTIHPAFEHFEANLLKAMSTIVGFFSNYAEANKLTGRNSTKKSYFIRIILVRLAANSTIAEHIDNGYSLCHSHRIHLPIVTNDLVKFSIGGMTKVMKEGELWEINNRCLHGVDNDSNNCRTHIIFDYVIPGEVVNDPISK